MLVPLSTKKVEVVCPICKTRDLIGIPEREIKKSSHLTTVSIQKGLICPHHFQIFIDRNLQIRGYQKVDFELTKNNTTKLRNGVKAFSLNQNNNEVHFKNLIQEGKGIKYDSLISFNNTETRKENQKVIVKRKKMTLEEIYEEFWEFIDGENEKFRDLINFDKRRKFLSTNSNLNKDFSHQELDQEI